MAAREHARHAAAAAAAERARRCRSKGEGGKPASVRERLEQHRKNPVCATLPCADGSARLRARELRRDRHVADDGEGGSPIDASGALPDGTTFDGPAGLRDVLLEPPASSSSDGHREAADLRARPRRRVLRHAGGPRRSCATRRPTTAGRRSFWHRQEHAVSDAISTRTPSRIDEVRDIMIITKKAHAPPDGPARAGRDAGAAAARRMVPALTALARTAGRARPPPRRRLRAERHGDGRTGRRRRRAPASSSRRSCSRWRRSAISCWCCPGLTAAPTARRRTHAGALDARS